MTQMRRDEHGWTLVLPVKGGRRAKSRLGAESYLARAIALDTIEAAVACPVVAAVVVVTTDPAIAGQATAVGARVLMERDPGAGLDAAVRDGLASLPATRAAGVLLADLPALRPDDLAVALDAVGVALARPGGPTAASGRGADGSRWAVVPDADRTGTVLLAGSATGMRPAFGPGSAAAHVERGAIRLDLDLPRLRRDVDTLDDLALAVRLGVGRNLTAALAAPHGALRLP